MSFYHWLGRDAEKLPHPRHTFKLSTGEEARIEADGFLTIYPKVK